jgi:hypothetical protein
VDAFMGLVDDLDPLLLETHQAPVQAIHRPAAV